MKLASAFLVLSIVVVIGASAQDRPFEVPKTVIAGSAFSVPTSGSGNATIYILGIGQAIKRDVQLGQAVYFEAGSLYNAGHYLAVLTAGGSSTNEEFDVVPAAKPTDLNFLAKPSRLPVGLHGGITGAVFVLDAYRNLIVAPKQVTFTLSIPSGSTLTRSVTTANGAVWTAMDSTPQQGADKFVAQVDDISSTRVIRQVPGDPCGLKMTAQPIGQRVQLKTDPVRDCSGNAVPDGTIVTFTEAYDGAQSTVDAPLKRGFAQVDMPLHPGATVSVASGVALGNQIRLEKK